MTSTHFLDRINRVFPHEMWRDVKTLVAVSGGADSVGLLRGLLESAKNAGAPKPENLIVTHVNHGLRGGESDDDAGFVQRLAEELGLEFRLGSTASTNRSVVTPDSTEVRSMANNTDAVGPIGTSEEHLRNFRYDQLMEVASKEGARYIATGHNLDDQVETILFRIFRGTGIAGLSGIPAFRLGNEAVTIVRPLLEINRVEIEVFLKSINQDFRIDSSNSDSKYTRNYLRHELIPELKKRFGESLPDSVVRLGLHASKVNHYLNSNSEFLRNSVSNQTSSSVQVNCKLLKDQPEVIVCQFLMELWIEQNWPRQAMTSKWWSAICDEIQSTYSQTVVLNLPGQIRFERTESSAEFTKF